ncbi:hypothetical protein B0P05DRAFT_592949 [Gilbertella persicaria]|nr:hypothetical protein B0P05DRAFT_592949 [Gilbertella persicaria]
MKGSSRTNFNYCYDTNPSWVNNPTLTEFCFSMIGRADIEESKSNVAMNAWLPQASYPCGHTFMVCIETVPASVASRLGRLVLLTPQGSCVESESLESRTEVPTVGPPRRIGVDYFGRMFVEMKVKDDGGKRFQSPNGYRRKFYVRASVNNNGAAAMTKKITLTKLIYNNISVSPSEENVNVHKLVLLKHVIDKFYDDKEFAGSKKSLDDLKL